MKGFEMQNSERQERVDKLIHQFWKNGYLTLSRKYGTFLPEPPKMGHYDIDALGKLKDQYAIGVTLSAEEMENPDVKKKLEYLASRHTRYTHKTVILFVAVPKGYNSKLRKIISSLNPQIRKNIKISTLQSGTVN